MEEEVAPVTCYGGGEESDHHGVGDGEILEGTDGMLD